MSDTAPGPGWWEASDGKWYPPETHPNYQPAAEPVRPQHPKLRQETPDPEPATIAGETTPAESQELPSPGSQSTDQAETTTPLAERALPSTATVARWRKYGRDRLYVNGPDGIHIGWRDLDTGGEHLDRPELADVFHSLVAAWLSGCEDHHAARRRDPLPAPEARPVGVHEIETTTEAPLPVNPGAFDSAGGVPQLADDPATSTPCDPIENEGWEDLAVRRPGASAREEAIRLKRQRPVRTLVERVLQANTDERAWRIGADGEEMVATKLAKLAKRDPRWRFLHAVPVGVRGSDIDHLVIGPPGVFTLNAKHHPNAKLWVGGDTFLINGHPQPYIRNSRFEARRAARLLSAATGLPVTATGVLVPVGAAEISLKNPPPDVPVVNRMRLVKWLRSRPETLTLDLIETIFSAARRSTTWQPLPPRTDRSAAKP